MKLPIGIQLYSVRDDMEKDMDLTLAKVKEIGYEGVEFAGIFGKSASEVKELLKKHSLTPVSAHVPLAEMIEDAEGVVKTYKEIGCMQIVIPYLMEEYRPGHEKWNEVIETAKKVGEICKREGIMLAYHNHDFEFDKVDGKYALDVLYSTIDESLLKTQIDTCWANVGGVNPAEYVEKYSGRCPTVHLKDFDGVRNDHMFQLIGIEEDEKVNAEDNPFELRPCGYGKQDMPSIMKSAAKAGAKWLIVEQDSPSMGKTPMECAKMSYDYLSKIEY